MFDFTPLATTHVIWAAIAFAVTYFSIQYLLRRGWLRKSGGGPSAGGVYYGGAMLVALTILFAAIPLQDTPTLLLGLIAAGAVVLVGGIWDEVGWTRGFQ